MHIVIRWMTKSELAVIGSVAVTSNFPTPLTTLITENPVATYLSFLLSCWKFQFLDYLRRGMAAVAQPTLVTVGGSPWSQRTQGVIFGSLLLSLSQLYALSAIHPARARAVTSSRGTNFWLRVLGAWSSVCWSSLAWLLCSSCSVCVCVCVCVCWPPFFKAPRVTLRGGWDMYCLFRVNYFFSIFIFMPDLKWYWRVWVRAFYRPKMSL